MPAGSLGEEGVGKGKGEGEGEGDDVSAEHIFNL